MTWRRAAAGAAAALMLLALGAWQAERWVAATVLPPLDPDTSVEVLDRNGALLRAYTVDDGRWRLAVDARGVDPLYVAMLLAYEDQRFFRHNGVDAVALLRAAAQALWNRRVVSGGSTLTMQLARLLEGGTTGAWPGKWRQIRLALALERELGKEAILALYLQTAPYGGNLEGVRAAARAWLGKEPARLTPAEAALMVALPQSPTARRPDRAPAAARAARDRVLARAVASGVLDAEAAVAASRVSVPTVRTAFPAHAPHLSDRLRQSAPDVRLHRTTLDLRLQRRLERLAAAALPSLPPRATLAMMVADHATGETLAVIGSAAWGGEDRQGWVDLSVAPRSPGSALKPLVYGLGFSDGLLHPETLMQDRPMQFGRYAPRNFDGRFRGPVTAREALQLSLNLPVVALTEALGPARLMAALRQAGTGAALPDDAPPGLAVALGGLGMSLRDLVQLYAAIARGGEAVALRDAPGVPLRGARLIGPQAAWHLGDILADAPRPARLPATRLAFKTGTSYGHRDALAVGFDGQHVAGVWIARADGAPMAGLYGVDAAAPLLFEAFARLEGGVRALPSAPPGTLQSRTASLPAPLRSFGERALSRMDGPRLAFPPDGAALVAPDGQILLRVDNGQAPFTWLADGAPLVLASREREAWASLPGRGFRELTVIDSAGRADRVRIELR